MSSTEVLAFAYGAVGKIAMYALSFFVIGIVAYRFVSLKRAQLVFEWGIEIEEEYDRKTSRAGIVAAGALIIVHLWRLFAQTYSIFGIDETVTLEFVRIVVNEMAWGTGWLVQIVAASGLLVAFAWARFSPFLGWWFTIPTAFAIAASLPFTGHAAAESANVALTIGSQTAHVAAGGLWLGTLAVIFFLGIGKPSSEEHDHSQLKTFVMAFSPVAITGVILVTISGVITAVSFLDHFNQLWTTAYGRLLLTKLALVGGVVGLGGYNRKKILPQLGDSSGTLKFRKITATELAVALVVLLVTAVLTGVGME